MRDHLRRNVVAYVALFAALGGTSYAAISLPKNSVGAAQLKRNAVTSKKVKAGSLLARDFKKGQLPAGPIGPQGPPGLQGIAGPPGADGAKGAAGLRPVKLLKITQNGDGKPVTLATVGPLSIIATCTGNAGGVTNKIEFSTTASGPAYAYKAVTETDGSAPGSAVGASTNIAFTPMANPGGHSQDGWFDVIYSDDAANEVDVSVFVRAETSGEQCRVVGSAIQAG